MKQITDVREQQQIELGILRHFKVVCDTNGLNYYLSNGTLLGAVKYKRFIPWDDDIDVFMPRADYERLMRVAEIDQAPYRLMARERDERWRLPFAKLCDMRTVKRENSADFGLEFGLEMDIFPLDAWSGGKWQAMRCGLWRRGLSASVQSQFDTPKKGLQRGILFGIWIVSRLLGVRFFQKRIDRELQRGRRQPSPEYLGSVAWSLYGKRELIPAEVFAGQILVDFEGDQYTAPIGYDHYLRQLYGDYEPDPPPDKQRTHHCFQVFWR